MGKRRVLSGSSDGALGHRLFKKRFLKYQESLDLLRQREARYYGNAPMALLDQIHDYEHAIASAEKAWAGKISFQKFADETSHLRLDVSFNRWADTLQTPDDFRGVLKQFHKNRGILEEKAAKYNGMAPLELVNQIDDYKLAIGSAEEVLAGRLSIQEFVEGTKGLILDLPSPSKLKRLLHTPDDFRRELLRLHKNHNILQERITKLNGNAPLHLLSQIEDYESAIGSAEEVLAGKLSIQEYKKGIASLNLDLPSVSILKRPLNTPDDFRRVIQQLNQDYSILRERETIHGLNVPLELVFQMEDYKSAMKSTEEVLAGRLSVQEFRKGVMPLILDY
jgi:hypothetical protein